MLNNRYHTNGALEGLRRKEYKGQNYTGMSWCRCVPSPFPHPVICSSPPTEQVFYQCSPELTCSAICLADGAGAECCHSPASTRACHHQELIDFMAGGEPWTQQEQQHLAPCLLTQCLQGKREWWRKEEAKEIGIFFHPVCHYLASTKC